jgi:hypothetical protein
MSYQDFGKLGLGSTAEKLGIEMVVPSSELYERLTQEFLPKKAFSPSAIFRGELQRGQQFYWTSDRRWEVIRKTRLIWPFLSEMEEKHPHLRVWEGATLNADPGQDLVGEPDFCVTPKDFKPKAPYCILVEAKQEDINEGWGQALAVMRGAQVLNEKQEKNISIYGVVSTGDLWQFGKLGKKQFVVYPPGLISILKSDDALLEALTLLDIIFTECEKNIT